jgi:hypothetical protein
MLFASFPSKRFAFNAFVLMSVASMILVSGGIFMSDFVRLNVRLTFEEHELIRGFAKENNLSIRDFVLNRALNKTQNDYAFLIDHLSKLTTHVDSVACDLRETKDFLKLMASFLNDLQTLVENNRKAELSEHSYFLFIFKKLFIKYVLSDDLAHASSFTSFINSLTDQFKSS